VRKTTILYRVSDEQAHTYTGSHRTLCSEGDLRRSRMARWVMAALALASGASVVAVDKSALEQISGTWERKIFMLKVDLHEPDPSGDTMQAATLERRGWHHHNPTGPIALRAGTRVEVTGIFNYSERGLFLEIAREDPEAGQEGIAARPRCRIRIMVETPPADPAGQAREAGELIGKVLGETASP